MPSRKTHDKGSRSSNLGNLKIGGCNACAAVFPLKNWSPLEMFFNI
jgi:hypothetical protein